jgi:hypothetical protein
MPTRNVIIVGAGPAGAALAYLLARRGLTVTLLEKHPEFARAFRGEGLQPSGVDALVQMGFGERLAQLPQAKVNVIELHRGGQLRTPLSTDRGGRSAFASPACCGWKQAGINYLPAPHECDPLTQKRVRTGPKPLRGIQPWRSNIADTAMRKWPDIGTLDGILREDVAGSIARFAFQRPTASAEAAGGHGLQGRRAGHSSILYIVFKYVPFYSFCKDSIEIIYIMTSDHIIGLPDECRL